jgi:molybdopterin-binding protein
MKIRKIVEAGRVRYEIKIDLGGGTFILKVVSAEELKQFRDYINIIFKDSAEE